MHELQVTEAILAIVLRHADAASARRVVSVRLTIGALSDLENEWIQKYFDYVSKGTLAERAALQIERTPAILRCRACRHEFPIEPKQIRDPRCIRCGEERCQIIAGREYKVEDMKVV